jgi:hypothetical protein
MPTQPLMEIVLILKCFIDTYGLLSNEKRVWSLLDSVGNRFQFFKLLKKFSKKLNNEILFFFFFVCR